MEEMEKRKKRIGDFMVCGFSIELPIVPTFATFNIQKNYLKAKIFFNLKKDG